MIPVVLRVVVGLASICFTVAALRLIAKGKLQLRYALVWFAFALVALFSAIWPDPIFELARSFGFKTPSNFIFFAGLLFLVTITIMLTVITSKQARALVTLVQENALLTRRVEQLESIEAPRVINQALCTPDRDGDSVDSPTRVLHG